MTFALKLWSVLLSCPDSHILLIHNTKSDVPSYVPTTGDQDEVKGQPVHKYLLDFLITARTSAYWEEASVRNAWLSTVRALLVSSNDQELLVRDLLNQTGRYSVGHNQVYTKYAQESWTELDLV